MDQINSIVRSSQFFWWLGHGTVLFSSLIYSLTLFQFNFLYRVAYFGALVSYLIVLGVKHKPLNFSMQYAARLVSDEGFSYALLAFYWLLLEPLAVTLVPFALFSVCHYVSYFRQQILPALYPGLGKELKARTGTPSTPAKVAIMLDDLQTKYAVPVINTAAMSEVYLVPVTLILKTFTFRISFLSLFFYAQFLRQRALQSSQTRAAFATLGAKLDSYLLQPYVPAVVQRSYIAIKGYMVSSIRPSAAPQRAR